MASAFAPYTADYRPIEISDTESAIRGMRLDKKADSELQALARRHAAIDAFASAVIAKACKVILAERDA